MLSATAIGALLGLGTQMYSNALRKLPYMPRIYPSISLFFFLLLANANSIPFLIHDFFGACRSVGARGRNGVGRGVCEPASEMGGPSGARPRQDARKGQGRQRKTLYRFRPFFSLIQLPQNMNFIFYLIGYELDLI